jgi:DNA-binding NtrC family response regulator
MATVLIVDDEEPVRTVLERWITAAGFEARVADSADNALQQMASAPCDVVLCDVQMPGRNGLWLTEQLRQHYPQTAIVLATGVPDVPGSTALQKGVVAYLLKPFERTAMLAAVRDGMEFRKMALAAE